MMRRDKFLTVTTALTVMQRHYQHGPMTTALAVQRLLKTSAGVHFDSVTLKIRGPVENFIALGGILWGTAAALGCGLSAQVVEGEALWEIHAHGEPEPGVRESDDALAERVFGGAV